MEKEYYQFEADLPEYYRKQERKNHELVGCFALLTVVTVAGLIVYGMAQLIMCLVGT